METVNHFKAALSAACAVLTALWGWFGWLIVAWVGCMLIDYITGTAVAWKSGTWSSRKARDGLWHKAGCVTAVAISGILDLVVGQLISQIPTIHLPVTYTVFLCPLVVVWYILTEAGSIVENAGALGADIPSWLRKAIALLRDQVDEAEDKKDE